MSEATNPKTNRVPLTTRFQNFFTWIPGFFTWIPRLFTWPVTVLCFILIFWSPLQKLIQALPDALANSETLTIGSLSLRVGKRLSDRANEEVRDALSGMDAADMTFVAQFPLGGKGISYSGDIRNISSELVDRWAKFEKLGLVTRKSDAELTQEAELNHQPKAFYGVEATAKYFKLRKFLLDILADAVTGGLRDSQPVRSGR
jgi:hypothetical protein